MIDWSASYAKAAGRIAARKALKLKPSAVSYEKLSKRIAEISDSKPLRERLTEIGFPTNEMAGGVSKSTIFNFVTDEDHEFTNPAFLYSILGLLVLDHGELILPEMARLEIVDRQRFTVAATELLGLDATGISAPVDFAGVYKLFRPHTILSKTEAMLCRLAIGHEGDAFACALEQRFIDEDGLKNIQFATGRLVPCGPRMIAMMQLRNCPFMIFIDTMHKAEIDHSVRSMSGIIAVMTENKKACAYPFYAVRDQDEFEPTDIQLADLPARAKKVFAQGVIHHEQLA